MTCRATYTDTLERTWRCSLDTPHTGAPHEDQAAEVFWAHEVSDSRIPPTIVRATVSVELDDGQTVTYYHEATPHRTVRLHTTRSDGDNDYTLTIVFPQGPPNAIQTTSTADFSARTKGRSVLEAARSFFQYMRTSGAFLD